MGPFVLSCQPLKPASSELLPSCTSCSSRKQGTPTPVLALQAPSDLTRRPGSSLKISQANATISGENEAQGRLPGLQQAHSWTAGGGKEWTSQSRAPDEKVGAAV